MEIRDPVHGAINLNKGEVQVLNSPAYQRLRAIKQLGFAEFSFPGATHNRFLHSIGVCHLSGIAFDSIFKKSSFSSPQVRDRLQQCLRLAALLHDIGHGPLSHAIEEVMPMLKELEIPAYNYRRSDIILGLRSNEGRRANHEDYTIKFITDSSLSEVLRNSFSDISPIHVACLVDKSLLCPDDFFIDMDINFRSILSQIVSSEMDVDRMDYLERDAYFCGTNYGRVELNWLLSNMTYYLVEGEMYLSLNRRALYTFDDFLLARHHMHLMVYFHHKSVIYEEMLYRYLTSENCSYHLPVDIEEYIGFTDYGFYQNIAQEGENHWARRMAERMPYRMLFELHSVAESSRIDKMKARMETEGLNTIYVSSKARLSKYHSLDAVEKSFPIYVVDQYDRHQLPELIEKSTEIFKNYEGIRRIDRLYVAPEDFLAAERMLHQERL